MFKRQYLLN